MTILFMYDSPLHPEAGGTERATKLVMDELERRGHTCIGLLHFNQNNPDEYFLNGAQIESLKDFLSENHVDVVINQIAFHYWLLKEFLAHGGQEWKDKGGKIVSFMHFDPPIRKITLSEVYKNWWSLPLKKKIKRLGYITIFNKMNRQKIKEWTEGYRYCYAKSDCYVLLSNSFIPDFKKIAAITEESRIRVIPNMLTFPDILTEDILNTKEKKVLVVSRMAEFQKRISIVLRSWRKVNHNGYELQIVGTGEDLERYKILALKYKLTDIVFLGQQSPIDYYKKASIFLMSSLFEGWGLTLTESLQNGVVPVVMNTISVFSDIIDDGETGFLANTESEFASYLQQLIDDDYLRSKMAKAGLKSACRFTPENVGEKWESMLTELK